MIKGKIVELWPVTKEDLPFFLEWRHKQSSGLRQGYRPLTSLNQEKFFEKISFDTDLILFSIFNLGLKTLPVGYVQLYPVDWKNRKAEAGIILKEEYHGKSFGEITYAQEALRLLVNYGFMTLGLNKIYAEIFEYNLVSIKLFERLGFKLDGIQREHHYWDGRFHNSKFYSILKREWVKDELKDD